MIRFFSLAVLLIFPLISACSKETTNGISDATDGCSKKEEASILDDVVPNSLWTVTDGITISLVQNIYPPGATSIEITLKNCTDYVLQYGQGFIIEKFENEVWRDVETVEDQIVTDEGYILYSHDSAIFTIDTGFLRDPLKAGIYRITSRPLSVAQLDEMGAFHSWKNYPPFQLEFIVKV